MQMGSITDEIQCENCNRYADCEYYYKTGEEYIFCSNCGYNYSRTLKNRDSMLLEYNEEKLLHPYGSYHVKYKNPSVAGYVGSLKDENTYIAFCLSVKEDKDIASVIVNRYVDDKFISDIIINNKEITEEDLPF